MAQENAISSRRAFFGLVAGAAASAVLADPGKLLWVPGAKLISIPAVLRVRQVQIEDIWFGMSEATRRAAWQALRSATGIVNGMMPDPRTARQRAVLRNLLETERIESARAEMDNDRYERFLAGWKGRAA